MILIPVNYIDQVINVLKHKQSFSYMVGSKLKGHPGKKFVMWKVLLYICCFCWLMNKEATLAYVRAE